MAHRADGLNDIFDENVTVRKNLSAGSISSNGDITANGDMSANNLSGTNTGDQTSIVGITGTKAQFDTALTDGSFAYSGGAFHDGFSDYVANEHIDWTNATDNLLTSGTGQFTNLGAGIAPSSTIGIRSYKVINESTTSYAGNTNQVNIYTGKSGGVYYGVNGGVYYYDDTIKSNNIFGLQFFCDSKSSSAGVYSQYAAFLSNELGDNINNSYGLYLQTRVDPFTPPTIGNAYGIYVSDFQSSDGSGNKYGIVLDSDRDGWGAIFFGAGQDSKIYYNGTDMIIDPKVVGSGELNVLGNIAQTDNVIHKFGTTDTDLQIYSDGTDGVIKVNNGLRLGEGSSNYVDVQPDGEINLVGNARVKRSIIINAAALRAPGATPATQVAVGTLETPAWQFANQGVEALQETLSFIMKLPEDMDRSVAPSLLVGWKSNSTGNAKWQCEYLYRQLDEDITASAQETLTGTTAASTTADGLVITEITGIDLPSSTDIHIQGRLTRLSADAQDTVEDTIELIGVGFSYTSNKLGTAI